MAHHLKENKLSYHKSKNLRQQFSNGKLKVPKLLQQHVNGFLSKWKSRGYGERLGMTSKKIIFPILTCLTNIEIKWLEDNDSIEKVLSNSCHAYATAPQWEAYPKSILSEADLQKIEEHKQQNMKDLEEADELGRTLLVRIGENAGDNHLVEYGKGSAAWVKD